jgi:predicted transcriptional regulator
MRKSKKNTGLLTSVELEFMTTLWKMQRASVRDIVSHESNSVDRAYTSVATVMKILEQKGFVASEKSDRALIYEPVVSKSDYQSRSLRDMSRTLFEDTPTALVARLVDDESLTDEMLEEMRAMLEMRIDKNAD